MANGLQMTLLECYPSLFQTQTSTVSDFLAKVSALQDSEEDSRIQEELSSLKSCDLLKKGSLRFYSEKMLQDFLTTTEEEPSQRSSMRWGTWGSIVNGRCLTADISESHRIEQESSLSDIFEGGVDSKYFLSQQSIRRLMSYKDTKVYEDENDAESNTLTAKRRDQCGIYPMSGGESSK